MQGNQGQGVPVLLLNLHCIQVFPLLLFTLFPRVAFALPIEVFLSFF